MILIDSGVMIDVWRDTSGRAAALLLAVIGREEIVLTRPIEMELLAGAGIEPDKERIGAYIATKRMIEFEPHMWRAAAELYNDLRGKGGTIRKLFDCCIAQVAIAQNLLLIHDDRDFDAIATHKPLIQYRLSLKATL
jgi:predicted nucleic acid-binding protein